MSYDNLSSVSQNILKSEQQFTHEELPSQRVCRGQNRHQVSPSQRHQSSKSGQPRGNSGVWKWDRELLRLEGASVGCVGCINSQPTRPSDETYIKPRSRGERLPSSVTTHYENYAHDEWSIGELLLWLNSPSLPITCHCFESRGV